MSPSSFGPARGIDRMVPWFFCAPAVALLLVFLVVPFLLALGLSFTDQRLLYNDDIGTDFVSLRNYGRLFSDEAFWSALRNNFLFVIVVVPLQSALALGLALLVNTSLPGVRVFRGIYFLPVATTMSVVAVVWSLLYSPDAGVVNHLVGLISFGYIGPQDWLRDPALVLPAVMAMSIWQGAGFQMLVFLAGLQSIPIDLYEAARLDGANRWQQFRHITLPMLKGTVVFVVVTTTIQAFQLYTQVQIVSSSGASAPVNSVRTMVMLMVQEGFRNGRVGHASALAVVFFLVVLSISLSQRLMMRGERGNP